jgi:iron complex outermembrane receptor protein
VESAHGAEQSALDLWLAGAYALVNAGIGIRSEDGHWTATVWSKNLFDKRYAAAFSRPRR